MVATLRRRHVTKAVTRIQVAIIAVLIILAGVVGTVYYAQLTAAPRQLEELRVAIGIEPDNLDTAAQTTTLVANLVSHMYETLVKVEDPVGEVKPLLAEKWSVSGDGLTYTFSLLKGVKFHDGAELDSNAVKATFERLTDPKTRSPQRGVLGHTLIDKVSAVDKFTVSFTLKKPFAPFLRGVASTHSAIVSPLAIQRYGTGIIDVPAGTGPFKFVRWNRADSLVFERFDDYWGDKATVRRVVFKIMPEAGTREAALLAGDVDVAVLPPASDVGKLQSNPGIKVYTPPTQRIIFIALNTQWGPLQDARVRQALNYAVDKKAIVEKVMFGLAKPAVAPEPEFLLKNAQIGFYEYNPQKAKQLLAQAGYPNGFKMTLIHPVGRYIQDKQIAEAIQSYLRDVGIDVELRTSDWPTFVATITKPLDEQVKLQQAVLLGWGYWLYDSHPQMFGQFHSSQWPNKGLAPAFYKNPKVDELLERASTVTDEGKRTEFYVELSKLIWEDSPWIFLHVQNYFIAAKASLKDFIVQNNEFFWVTYVKSS